MNDPITLRTYRPFRDRDFDYEGVGRGKGRDARYFPRKKSIIGGKVIRSAAMNIAKETALIRAKLTSRLPQRCDRNSQAASQTRMATLVTPDNGPVGFQTFRAAEIIREASPAKANSASAKEPIAAANNVAAPRPFVILSA